jgi:hypothetical protein
MIQKGIKRILGLNEAKLKTEGSYTSMHTTNHFVDEDFHVRDRILYPCVGGLHCVVVRITRETLMGVG